MAQLTRGFEYYPGRFTDTFQMKFANGWTFSYSALDNNMWAWDENGRNDTPSPLDISNDNEMATYMIEVASK